MEQAQSSRSRAQALADRAAAFLFYVATAAGLITYISWTIFGEARSAVERKVTVLVIACPHALGLAIPLVISISTALSARNGILVKDRLALERMREVDVVRFDKTGTLTAAQHVVTGVAGSNGDADEVLALAGAVESDSEHPLARAIVSAAKDKGRLPKATNFRSMTARGVEANVDDRSVAVGGPKLTKKRNARLPDNLRTEVEHWSSRGAAVLLVQNLVWATGYNAFAIPIAAGVLTWAGVTLSPAVGAILMSLSTIIVAANAQLLRRLDLRPADADGTLPIPAREALS